MHTQIKTTLHVRTVIIILLRNQFVGREGGLSWSFMPLNAFLWVVTFTRILPFRLWGLGSCLVSPGSIDDRSSLSWNIPFRYWAIFLCCWTLQWFSIDSMTGNLREQQHILKAEHGNSGISAIIPCSLCSCNPGNLWECDDQSASNEENERCIKKN